MKQSSPPSKFSPDRLAQFRRSTAARRAKADKLEVLLPPDLNAVLTKVTADLEGGKTGYVIQLLSKHFQRKGLYTPPPPET